MGGENPFGEYFEGRRARPKKDLYKQSVEQLSRGGEFPQKPKATSHGP